jgi:hypothetical protein
VALTGLIKSLSALFLRSLQDVARDHMPVCRRRLKGSPAVFYSRGSVPVPQEDVFERRPEPDAYDAAREAAPGWDTRLLKHEWRRWCGRDETEPKHPTKHYVKFCVSWFEKMGRP